MWQYILSSLAGMLGGGALVMYLIKHRMERRKDHIALELERKGIENAQAFVNLFNDAKSKGLEIKGEFQTITVQKAEWSREDLEFSLNNTLCLWLQDVFHICMRIEGLEGTEYQEMLDSVREGYIVTYKRFKSLDGNVDPAECERPLQTYYDFCCEPSLETASAFAKAYDALDIEKYQQRLNEIIKRLEQE